MMVEISGRLPDDEPGLPPRHLDIRIGAHRRRWFNKVTIRLDDIDISERCIAAHAGEGWALLGDFNPDGSPRLDRHGRPSSHIRRGRVEIIPTGAVG